MGRTRKNWTAAPWRDVEHLQCAMTIPETADCATFAFRAPSGAWFDDQPGHFLTLELPVPGGPLLRTCTISSRPSRPLSISVTVKAQPGSAGSRRMQDNLKPGMRIKAHGPSGDFSFHRHPAPKYLFISSGSGITPMMSMTPWAWGVRRDAGHHLHSCRPQALGHRVPSAAGGFRRAGSGSSTAFFGRRG